VPGSRWGRGLLFLVVVLGLLYVAIVLGESRFIYFPDRALSTTPADAGIEYRNVYFETEDGVRLNGWWVPARDGEGTILWFHGNAGNLSDRVGPLESWHDELGVGVFMFDYRGYGASEGRPTEEGLYADARAALDAAAAEARVSPDELVLFGQSLGAAVAVELAGDRRVRGVVLEAAFTSIPDMARHHYSFLPVWPLLRTDFDSESRIAEIEAPLLMLHGRNDDIVPIDMGRRVFAAAREPKEFNEVSGAGHNDVYLAADYVATLRDFLSALNGAD
jgi:fermentation-respiration switch protein FrsA (DUF1100 family)